MKALVGLVIAAGIVCLPLAVANAATLNVPDDHPTIQAAIDAAKPGDTVLVAPGEYRETLRLSSGVRIKGVDRDEVLPLVRHFAAEARSRIASDFKGIKDNRDRMGYRLAQQMLKGPADWLLDGIVGETSPQPDAEEQKPDKVMA